MKRLKSIILFVIIILIVCIINFFIYKNVDLLIPKHQNKLYIFANNAKSEKTDFVYELCAQIDGSYELKRVIDENTKIKEDYPIVYNCIKYCIYSVEIPDEVTLDILGNLYMGNLINTKYGDLKFVTKKSKKGLEAEYYIAYSNDMKNMFFCNMEEFLYANSPNSMTTYDSDEISEFEETTSKNREVIIKGAKEIFTKVITDIEFNPETIIYKTNYYVLKDEQKDITVYYNDERNTLPCFYIGFLE